MSDDGGISRRALLIGGAGTVAVLGAGAAVADVEIDSHPSLRQRIFGCGSSPAVPRSTYRTQTTPLASRAMKATLPITVSLPADRRPDENLPLVVVLPGRGDDQDAFVDHIGYPGWASAAGLRLAFASPGGTGATYYHPRSNGTDCLSYVTDELVPYVERKYAVGGAQGRRGVIGWSMGGYGALLVAQQRPDLVAVAVGSSPAVFPSYSAAITGHSDTFDSAADWERYGVWPHLAAMHGVAVKVDCGTADPFVTTARQLVARIPDATGTIDSGCHDEGFWRRNASRELRFLGTQLA